MSRARPVVALLVLPLAVSVVAACGQSGGAGAAPPPAAAIGQIDINPQPLDKLRDGGELNWPIEDYPSQFNELQANVNTDDTEAVTRSIMPTPMVEQADGSFKADPDYVTSAKLQSTDPQVVRFTLNRKAQWSDGSPITWADYRSQWQAMNGKNTAYEVITNGGWENITDVERGTDDYDFTVTFAPKYAEWYRLYDVLYPKSLTATPAAFNKDYQQDVKLTGGPFKVQKLDKTDQTIIVERDPAWWGAKPKLDRIVFRHLSTTGGTASVDALANKELDFTGVSANLDAYEKVKTMPGVTLRRATLPNYRWILFNGAGSSTLKDPELRKALIRGINVQAITKAEASKLIPDAKPLGNHVFIAGFPGYEDNSVGYGYDPEAAKKRLDELGWKMDGQFRKKNGKQLTVRDVVPADTKASVEEAQLVQNQLGAIGVEVKVDTVDSSGFFDKHIQPGDFDITHFAHMESGTITDVLESYTLSDQVLENFGRIGSDQVNSLLNQAAQELDATKRQALLNQVDKQLWNLGFAVPLYRRPSIVAVRDGLANFGDAGLAAIDYTKVGWLK